MVDPVVIGAVLDLDLAPGPRIGYIRYAERGVRPPAAQFIHGLLAAPVGTGDGPGNCLLHYLKGLPQEELVVGFGVAQDTRTRIDSVIKIRGEADHVEWPRDGAATIHGFLSEDERHTAIFVHNHPEIHPVMWLLGLVFGTDPLSSLTDRDFGVGTLLRRFQSRLEGIAFDRVRFYLVQNDAISELSGFTPALLLVLMRIAHSVL